MIKVVDMVVYNYYGSPRAYNFNGNHFIKLESYDSSTITPINQDTFEALEAQFGSKLVNGLSEDILESVVAIANLNSISDAIRVKSAMGKTCCDISMLGAKSHINDVKKALIDVGYVVKTSGVGFLSVDWSKGDS